MNIFIEQFVKDYIYEIQNIPYYNRDKLDGITRREILVWFDDKELEEIFKDAKNNVTLFLLRNNIAWVKEKSAFAEIVEKTVILEMVNECFLRIVNEDERNKRIAKDSRLKDFWTEEMVNNVTHLCITYKNSLGETFKEIKEKAELFHGKSLLNSIQ